MKAGRASKFAGAAFLALVLSLSARAQNSDATEASATIASSHPSKPERAANRALQRKVRAALVKSKGLNVSNVSVRARNGAVTLEGTVPTQDEIDRAVQTTQGVSGVASVNNALTLRVLGH